MDYVAYGMVLIILLGDAATLYVLHRKLNRGDASTPEGEAARKKFQILRAALVIQAILISAVIITVIKPMLGTISD